MTTRWGRLPAYLVFAIFVATLAGLVSVNYLAALALFTGFLLSAPAWRLVLFVTVQIKRSRAWYWRGRLMIVVFLLALCVLLCLILLPFLPSLPMAARSCSLGPIVDKYHVIIEPDAAKEGIFRVKEVVTNPCPALKRNPEQEITVDIAERETTSSSRGVFLKEVTILPLQYSEGTASLYLPESALADIPAGALGHVRDGVLIHGPLCVGDCPESTVELRDLPSGSFYAAKGAGNLARSPYIDTEKISWSVQDPEEGIVFAYIPAPFYYVRPLIEPFAPASSASGALFILFALIGAVVSPMARTVLTDKVQKELGAWIDKRTGANRQAEPRPKPKIVVSGTGEEREVPPSEERRR